jgi:hypothetical protein
LDKEEFVGYDNISLTESDEPEDIKVGKLSHLQLWKVLTIIRDTGQLQSPARRGQSAATSSS